MDGISGIRPDESAFERLVEAALDRIPEPFRSALESVVILVEDEPSREQLASVGLSGTLHGLYQGVPRTAYGADHAPVPSRITIFRGPLERAYRDPARLARGVEETVIHEIAHHLGIDDARIRELQTRGR